MNLSDAGAKYIASHELPLPADGTIPSKYLRPYNDPVGFATIGVGHLIARRSVTKADHDHWGVLTQQQAYDLFKADAQTFVNAVNALVSVPITQNQFDALVSFSFNLGSAALRSSTLLKKLNRGDYVGAADEFPKWNKAGKPLKVQPGLVKRRASERELFLTARQSPAVVPTNLTRGPSANFGKAEWMHPVFRQRLESLHDEVPFSVTSGGRSTKRQAELYRLFLAGKGNPANRPGTSWHEYEPDGSMLAQAADIEPLRGHTDAELHRAARKYGLHFPLDHEPWHIQAIEAKSSKRVPGQGLSDDLTIYSDQDEEEEMPGKLIADPEAKMIYLQQGTRVIPMNKPGEKPDVARLAVDEGLVAEAVEGEAQVHIIPEDRWPIYQALIDAS